MYLSLAIDLTGQLSRDRNSQTPYEFLVAMILVVCQLGRDVIGYDEDVS